MGLPNPTHVLKGSTYAEDLLNERLDVGEEINTGRRFLGKTVYRKVLAITADPNEAWAVVPHGVTGIGPVVSVRGMLATAGGAAYDVATVGISSCPATGMRRSGY